MAVRDRQRRWTGDRAPTGSTSRYDLHLAAIPLVFLLAILGGLVVEIPVRGSIFVASLLGAVVVADGLFVNPPEVGGRE